MHMVADMSDQAASADEETVAVCSVGVYGTKYVRSGEQVPETIEISQGQSTTITIENIQSYVPIGNQLAIDLR